MPELPEVETIVRQLRPLLTGRSILRARVSKPDILREISASSLRRHLRDASICSVTRRAKHAVLHLDTGRRLVVKPGMTGTLIHYVHTPTVQARRYAVVTLLLDDETVLIHRDVRRIGSVWLMDESAWARYNQRVGAEPLAEGFSVDQFVERLRGTRQVIKKALMDQGRVVGIGNIYANEILFDAKISPRCRTSGLRRAEFQTLYDSMRRKLIDAIAARGTTLQDYRTGVGDEGTFQRTLQVYGRGGEDCSRCGETLITTHSLDNRATTYCPKCQRCRARAPENDPARSMP